MRDLIFTCVILVILTVALVWPIPSLGNDIFKKGDLVRITSDFYWQYNGCVANFEDKAKYGGDKTTTTLTDVVCPKGDRFDHLIGVDIEHLEVIQ